MAELKGSYRFLWIPPNIVGVVIVLLTAGFDFWKITKVLLVVNLIGIPVWVSVLVVALLVGDRIYEGKKKNRLQKYFSTLDKEGYEEIVKRIGDRREKVYYLGEEKEFPLLVNVLNYSYMGGNKPKELEGIKKRKVRDYLELCSGRIDDVIRKLEKENTTKKEMK